MEKRFSRAIKTLPLIIGFLIPVALSAWVIESSDRKNAPTSYEPSQLTEYIASNTSGTNYIFENVNLGQDEGNESGFYSSLTTDRTYQNIDGFHRNIYLGYSDGRTLNIDHNVVFTHTQSKIDYSEKEFLEKSTFTPKDGDGDNGTDGSYYVKYFSDKTNATNNALSYIPKYNKTINYYRNNNSSKSLSYRDYKSDGTYETKTYTPKGYLYTIKLAGNLIIKKGSFLSIGALVMSTNGGGEAGGIIQGNNVELDLNGHTITIEEGATLNAYGYIVDTKTNADGSLKGAIYNHGTIYSPMVVCDYSGGGNTVGRAFANIVPFSMFNMPYLSAKVYFYNTSKLLCPTALYASSTLSKIVCKIIGNDSDSFIQLEDSSSVLISETKNNRSDDQEVFYSGDEKNDSETKDGFRCNLIFKGDVRINSLKLNVVMKKSKLDINVTINASFDLAAFYFPVAPFYDLVIEDNARVTCPLTLEFYPGSHLLAKEKSQIILSSSQYNNHYTVKIASTTDYLIKKGTSYGGIVVPTELPPSGDSSYYYYIPGQFSNNPYSFQTSNFDRYLRDEYALLTKKEPRIRIGGQIGSNLSGSEVSNHVLTGYIDIDTNKNSSFLNNCQNFSLMKKEFQYVSPTITSVAPFSMKFQDELIGTKIRYLYFKNIFVSAEKYDINLFDENGNLVTRNSDGTYTLKYSYAGYSGKELYVKNGEDYSKASNVGEGNYLVTSTIDSSTDYSTFLKKVKSQIDADLKTIDLNGQQFNSIIFKQLSSSTINKFGTFKSASFRLTGYPQLYKLSWFKYRPFDDPIFVSTGDLSVNYHSNFKTRLRFDKNFGSWVKTSNAT